MIKEDVDAKNIGTSYTFTQYLSLINDQEIDIPLVVTFQNQLTHYLWRGRRKNTLWGCVCTPSQSVDPNFILTSNAVVDVIITINGLLAST